MIEWNIDHDSIGTLCCAINQIKSNQTRTSYTYHNKYNNHNMISLLYKNKYYTVQSIIIIILKLSENF
jgi:hypothetical protein